MAFITSGVCEIKAYGQLSEAGGGAKNIVQVWHYAQQTPQSVLPDPNAIIDNFQTSVMLVLLPLLHEDYVQTLVSARWIDMHSNPEVEKVQNGRGVKSGDRLPSYNSVVFQLRTPYRGKEFRGSKHFAGIAEADTLEDQLQDPALTQWKNFIGNILLGFTIGGQSILPCILSRKNSQLQKDPVTIQAAFLNGAVLNKTIGTMRKRKMKTVIA